VLLGPFLVHFEQLTNSFLRGWTLFEPGDCRLGVLLSGLFSVFGRRDFPSRFLLSIFHFPYCRPLTFYFIRMTLQPLVRRVWSPPLFGYHYAFGVFLESFFCDEGRGVVPSDVCLSEVLPYSAGFLIRCPGNSFAVRERFLCCWSDGRMPP